MKDKIMPIGTELLASKFLIRTRDHSARIWEKIDFPKPIPVYFLGYRTLWNGSCTWSDEGPDWRPKEKIKVVLVIKNQWTKPFYIPIDEMA